MGDRVALSERREAVRQWFVIIWGRVRYNAAYQRRKRSEAFWVAVARRLPRELKRWTLVHIAVNTMGSDKGPDYCTYATMARSLDH